MPSIARSKKKKSLLQKFAADEVLECLLLIGIIISALSFGMCVVVGLNHICKLALE